MAPILAGIVTMLADKGLDLISGAINGGADKAVEFVKEKTGIDLESKTKLSVKEVAQLKSLEIADKARLEELAYKHKVEDNRHSEASHRAQIEDRASAREMFNHAAELQTNISGRILSQTKWLIPIYMLLNIILIVAASKFAIESSVVLAAGNLLGIGLAKAYEERSKVTSFLFGAEIKKETK